ncbi:MAG: cytidine deaminase [Paludibacteraceae bacterium]|nr:cytidine deaminase [Paludibacteraceae bacterium]
MKDLKITSNIRVYEYDELPADLRELVDEAKKMVFRSYSPYSNFKVGAAARLSSGRIQGGSNQENAAYPSGLCAERTTLFAVGAMYPDESVEALAIAAYTNGDYTEMPTAPCGACRQVMLESENRGGKPMKVLLYGKKCTYVVDSVDQLMPLTFLPDDLQG